MDLDCNDEHPSEEIVVAVTVARKRFLELSLNEVGSTDIKKFNLLDEKTQVLVNVDTYAKYKYLQLRNNLPKLILLIGARPLTSITRSNYNCSKS